MLRRGARAEGEELWAEGGSRRGSSGRGSCAPAPPPLSAPRRRGQSAASAAGGANAPAATRTCAARGRRRRRAARRAGRRAARRGEGGGAPRVIRGSVPAEGTRRHVRRAWAVVASQLPAPHCCSWSARASGCAGGSGRAGLRRGGARHPGAVGRRHRARSGQRRRRRRGGRVAGFPVALVRAPPLAAEFGPSPRATRCPRAARPRWCRSRTPTPKKKNRTPSGGGPRASSTAASAAARRTGWTARAPARRTVLRENRPPCCEPDEPAVAEQASSCLTWERILRSRCRQFWNHTLGSALGATFRSSPSRLRVSTFGNCSILKTCWQALRASAASMCHRGTSRAGAAPHGPGAHLDVHPRPGAPTR